MLDQLPPELQINILNRLPRQDDKIRSLQLSHLLTLSKSLFPVVRALFYSSLNAYNYSSQQYILSNHKQHSLSSLVQSIHVKIDNASQLPLMQGLLIQLSSLRYVKITIGPQPPQMLSISLPNMPHITTLKILGNDYGDSKPTCHIDVGDVGWNLYTFELARVLVAPSDIAKWFSKWDRLQKITMEDVDFNSPLRKNSQIQQYEADFQNVARLKLNHLVFVNMVSNKPYNTYAHTFPLLLSRTPFITTIRLNSLNDIIYALDTHLNLHTIEFCKLGFIDGDLLWNFLARHQHLQLIHTEFGTLKWNVTFLTDKIQKMIQYEKELGGFTAFSDFQASDSDDSEDSEGDADSPSD